MHKSISSYFIIFSAALFLLSACSGPADESAQESAGAEVIEAVDGVEAVEAVEVTEVTEATESTEVEPCTVNPPKEPFACTMQYDPVCGCDGKTYGNACSARGAGVSSSTPGACENNTVE